MTLQVGVKIFLKNKDGKYLLVRRSPDKYKNIKGNWDIVGGRIDVGSSLMENLAREVKEETQLNITSDPTLICAQDIMPNSEKHVVRLSYVGSTEGEPVLDMEENIEYKWLSMDEMRQQEDIDVYVEEILKKGLLK